MEPVFKVLRNGLLLVHSLHMSNWCNPCSKCYGMDCFGTYFTHVQTCDVTRVRYILYTYPNLWWNPCSKCHGMDCFWYILYTCPTDVTRVQRVLRNGLLRYILYTCPNLWCNPCSNTLLPSHLSIGRHFCPTHSFDAEECSKKGQQQHVCPLLHLFIQCFFFRDLTIVCLTQCFNDLHPRQRYYMEFWKSICWNQIQSLPFGWKNQGHGDWSSQCFSYDDWQGFGAVCSKSCAVGRRP